MVSEDAWFVCMYVSDGCRFVELNLLVCDLVCILVYKIASLMLILISRKIF